MRVIRRIIQLVDEFLLFFLECSLEWYCTWKENRDERKCYRAHQDCRCPKCGKRYIDHPMDLRSLSWQDEPFLHVLCNGDRVKL